LREADQEFAEAWEAAIEDGTQVLENEAVRRALEGWDEDVYDGEGAVVRRTRRYNPALLIFLLKARRPEVYRDQVARVEVTGANGGPVEIDGFQPTSIASVVALARELGLVDVVDGEAVEAPLELGEAPGG